MKNIALITALCLLLSNCATSKLSNKSNKESVDMKIEQKSEVINYALLEKQNIPTLASRISKDREGDRGLITAAMVGQAISLGTSAVKKMIETENKKYMAEYKSGLTDLYFYDQLSAKSAFDPIGMHFKGFTFVRTFKNKDGKKDTAIIAHFSLDIDSANLYEIFNNSIFHLKLDSIEIRYAKAKVSGSRWYMPWTLVGKKNDERLHMDFEITFTSTYVNKTGTLFNNMELGKFYYSLRDAPIDKSKPGYSHFYDSLKGGKVAGYSFLVPRSFGYYYVDGDFRECYSRGQYNILVKVKESSKDKFVDKLIMSNSNQIVDGVGGALKNEIQKIATPKKSEP